MCDGIPWQKSSITLLTEGLFFFKTYLGQECSTLGFRASDLCPDVFFQGFQASPEMRLFMGFNRKDRVQFEMKEA